MKVRLLLAIRYRSSVLLHTILLFLLCTGFVEALRAANEGQVLWRIGKPDKSNLEFALAPKSYEKFKEDGFFVVGDLNAETNWPYVHPGPSDGVRPHRPRARWSLRLHPVRPSVLGIKCARAFKNQDATKRDSMDYSIDFKSETGCMLYEIHYYDESKK